MDGEKSALAWFEEGREACLAGTGRDANPYPEGQHSHECWARGYDDAAGRSDREKGYG